MRANVFTDRALEQQAGRFVWLSIDTEKEQNAPFLAKFPVRLYPTLLVIDSRREEAVFRWLGGASAPQLGKLLDDGERAARGEGSGADALLAQADRQLGAGRSPEAAKAYRRAIARAPRGWPQRDRAIESLLAVLGTTGEERDCLRLAKRELPAERDAHFATVAVSGLGCALSVETKEGRRAAALFEPLVEAAARDDALELSGDDRSALFGVLVQAREAAGDAAGQQRLAGEWLDFLEAEAARAPTPDARVVYDSHRLGAALALGQPERAIAALLQSETDFPADYNPPSRLALAYLESGRYDEALAAADRALGRAYGPRKLRIYSIKADILEKKGDPGAATATLEEALSYAGTLPDSQVPERMVEALRTRLTTRPG